MPAPIINGKIANPNPLPMVRGRFPRQRNGEKPLINGIIVNPNTQQDPPLINGTIVNPNARLVASNDDPRLGNKSGILLILNS